RTKGGLKLHTLFDHDGYLPAFVAVSPAREPDIKKARSLRLPKGSIVVEDLGYTDYAWYAQLTTQKIFFVTRQKRNAAYEVVEGRTVNKTQGLLLDQTIQLTGVKALECSVPLRRIVYRDAASGKHYVFLTNHFKLSARTIADLQGALANRDFLPMDQAESKDQGLHRQLGKRRAEPNFYGAHGLSAALLSQILVQPWHYFAKLDAIITTQSIQNLYP